MLHGMRAEQVEYNFYENFIGLPEFLTITDKRLQEIGIEFPYLRKRILHGLLKFHEKSWSRGSLCIPKINANIHDYFDVFSNSLKQLIVIEAAIKFADHHEIFNNSKDGDHDDFQILRKEINTELVIAYKNILELFKAMQMVEKVLSTPPPMYIGKDIINKILKGKTFRQSLYQKLKIIGGIGLGLMAVAVIKSRLH